MTMKSISTTAIHRFDAKGALTAADDSVAIEEPLEIRVEGQTVAIIMRTPGEDLELAAGFLLTEGIIRSAKDLFDLSTCEATAKSRGNVVDAALAKPSAFDIARFSRHVFTSSSCGICGKTSIDAVMKKRRALTEDSRFSRETILSLPRRVQRKQPAFHATGGVHACALFTADGQLVALREDVGRHNALDKLIGWALLEKRTPLAGHVVLLSGRASFEMLQKAHAAGIPAVVAIGAPSSLAVEFAQASNQVLCGFVRGKSMNVYAGSERIG